VGSAFGFAAGDWARRDSEATVWLDDLTYSRLRQVSREG